MGGLSTLVSSRSLVSFRTKSHLFSSAPFLIMGRVTYLHHYVCLICVLLGYKCNFLFFFPPSYQRYISPSWCFRTSSIISFSLQGGIQRKQKTSYSVFWHSSSSSTSGGLKDLSSESKDLSENTRVCNGERYVTFFQFLFGSLFFLRRCSLVVEYLSLIDLLDYMCLLLINIYIFPPTS